MGASRLAPWRCHEWHLGPAGMDRLRFAAPSFQPQTGHEAKAKKERPMKQPYPRPAGPTGGEMTATPARAALALAAVILAACNGGAEKRNEDASVPADAAADRSSAVDRPVDQGSPRSPVGVA